MEHNKSLSDIISRIDDADGNVGRDQTPQEPVEETPQEPIEEPVEEKITEEEALANAKNPERTQKYIEQLKEERDTAISQNVLDSLNPDSSSDAQEIKKSDYQNLNQADIDGAVKEMVTEDGYLDGNKLRDLLKNMDERVRLAEEKALEVTQKQKNREIAEKKKAESDLMARVHEKYPMLDPENKDTLDVDFYDAVRNDLIGQMMEGQRDPMKAADKWYKKLYRNQEVNKEEREIKERKEQQKSDINAVNRPSGGKRVASYKEDENADLRKKIQQGKKGALAEYLRKIGQ